MTKLLKISAFAVPACAMLALAQPASAAGRAATATATANSTTAASTGSGEAGAAPEKKYCYFIDPPTGSRAPEHKCRTKAQWQALGFEITKKK